MDFKKSLIIIAIGFISIIVLIALLQVVGVFPKRCDDLGPGEIRDADGNVVGAILPSGVHCYGIWHPWYWEKPGYL